MPNDDSGAIRESDMPVTLASSPRMVRAHRTRQSERYVIWRLPSLLLVFIVRMYQLGISPWLGPRCRFHPTCSQYFIESVTKYGSVRGSWRGIRRVLKCHPWHPGGEDLP
jgi:hypothetical protein